jgi:hypothetical protein
MQVNSAQDYLTAQKRRIVAATFTQNPPALQRKYNYVVTSVIANKATQYDKVFYPQTISLAPGSTPGLIPQSQWKTPGIRPTVNSCCIVAQGATPLAGSLV